MSQVINWIRSGNNALNAQTIIYTLADGDSELGKSLLAAWSSKWSGSKMPDDQFDYIYNNFSFEEQYDKLINLGSIYDHDMKPLEDETNSRLYQYFTTMIETATLKIINPKTFAVKVATEMAKEYGKQLDEIVLLRVTPYFHDNWKKNYGSEAGSFLENKELIIFLDQSGDLRGGYYIDSVDRNLITPEDFISNFLHYGD